MKCRHVIHVHSYHKILELASVPDLQMSELMNSQDK